MIASTTDCKILRKKTSTKAVLLALAGLTVTSGMAVDSFAGLTPHEFTYVNDDVNGPAIAGTSAVIESVFGLFDEASDTFQWNATYSADSKAELPTGFTLVVNDGPMPKTHLGELAVLYFEAEDLLSGFTEDSEFASLTSSSTTGGLSAYAYNGGSSASAHRTSDFRDVQSATPDAPDKIASSRSASDRLEYAVDLTDSKTGDKFFRTVALALEATPILAHSPLQPSIDVDADEPLTWTGIGFAEEIGIWFHPFNNINAEYGEDGFLLAGIGGTNTVNRGWQVLRDNYGFFDVDNLQATTKDGLPIPEPASAMLLLAGVSLVARRQR